MKLERIAGIAHFDRIQRARVCMVGCGASADLAAQLARSGFSRFILVDPDAVGPENLCRQGFDAADLGEAKVDAVSRRLRRINPEIEVCTFQQRFDRRDVRDVSLYLALTDSTNASLEVNRAVIESGAPGIWAGVYDRGLAGEVAFWRPGLPCYRCLFPSRTSDLAPTPSTAVSIFDTSFVDAIVGQLALGLLSGPDTRFGRMVDALGNRNFLRIKIDPFYAYRGRDVVGSRLGVTSNNPNYFAWCTSAERDPDYGIEPCPACTSHAQ